MQWTSNGFYNVRRIIEMVTLHLTIREISYMNYGNDSTVRLILDPDSLPGSNKSHQVLALCSSKCGIFLLPVSPGGHGCAISTQRDCSQNVTIGCGAEEFLVIQCGTLCPFSRRSVTLHTSQFKYRSPGFVAPRIATGKNIG